MIKKWTITILWNPNHVEQQTDCKLLETHKGNSGFVRFQDSSGIERLSHAPPVYIEAEPQPAAEGEGMPDDLGRKRA